MSETTKYRELVTPDSRSLAQQVIAKGELAKPNWNWPRLRWMTMTEKSNEEPKERDV